MSDLYTNYYRASDEHAASPAGELHTQSIPQCDLQGMMGRVVCGRSGAASPATASRWWLKRSAAAAAGWRRREGERRRRRGA